MNGDSGPETALWRAVIAQAINDACDRKLPSPKADGIAEKTRQSREANLREARRIRMQARDWLLRDNRDFRHVCHMAGLDPDAVRERAQKLARNGWDAKTARWSA